jgi:hypothetical protein
MLNLYEIKTNKVEVSCTYDTSTRTVDILTYNICYYVDEPKRVFKGINLYIDNVDEVKYYEDEWDRIVIKALNKEVIINEDGDIKL